MSLAGKTGREIRTGGQLRRHLQMSFTHERSTPVTAPGAQTHMPIQGRPSRESGQGDHLGKVDKETKSRIKTTQEELGHLKKGALR